MRRAITALAVACACLGVAGEAAADVRQATLGDVVARLTLTRRDFSVQDLQLTVTRAGTVVYDAPVTTSAGRPGALQRTPPVRRFIDARLRVLDLDGDGTGEAIVDLAERGSYCCSHTVIVGAGPDGAYHPLELDWGSYGIAATYAPLERGYALVAGDGRLEEQYTPHVLSFVPARIWYWSRGAVEDVSRQQPLLVQADLAGLLATRRQLLHRRDHATIDLRGLETAIVGDRLLLGEGEVAAQRLGADVAAGRLGQRSGSGPVGTHFPPVLFHLLARFGY